MKCYITSTGSYLPGDAIDNDSLQKYLGTLLGESRIKDKILKINGIKQRHYALDKNQQATHNIYELAALAVEDCLEKRSLEERIDYLSAGSTNTPYIGPGLSSVLHSELKTKQIADYPLEINSNSGICSSAAQAFANAYRSIKTGEHATALCVGVEQPSEILKSKAIKPVYDIRSIIKDVRKSKWFMSVFLRFMLSDGAGVFLLENKPTENGTSFAVDWVYSQSFANQAPLCMKLENKNLLLSQDVEILSKYLVPCAREFVANAMSKHNVDLGDYRAVLPHLSSYFFKKKMENVLKEFTRDGSKRVEYWTNLSSAGNTGAASIYIMLDEFLKTHQVQNGEKILLFVPESGQFNFVLISLTAVVQ